MSLELKNKNKKNQPVTSLVLVFKSPLKRFFSYLFFAVFVMQKEKKKAPATQPVLILEQDADVVEDYKYL